MRFASPRRNGNCGWRLGDVTHSDAAHGHPQRLSDGTGTHGLALASPISDVGKVSALRGRGLLHGHVHGVTLKEMTRVERAPTHGSLPDRLRGRTWPGGRGPQRPCEPQFSPLRIQLFHEHVININVTLTNDTE